LGRKPSQQVNSEINRLRRVLETSNKSDIELIEELQIKKATFYRYKETIREQDKEAWQEIAKESLEERSKKIMDAINFALTNFKDIAINSNDDRAKIEANKNVIQANVWAKELLEKGPTKKVISKVEDGLESKDSMESLEKQTV
jgi:ACT domain-containing protein